MLAYIVSFCPENLPLALPVWTWSLAVKLTGEPRRQNGTNEGVEKSRAVAFQPAVLHGLRGRLGKFSGNNLVEGEHAVSGFSPNSTQVVIISMIPRPFTVCCDEFPATCRQTRLLPTGKI